VSPFAVAREHAMAMMDVIAPPPSAGRLRLHSERPEKSRLYPVEAEDIVPTGAALVDLAHALSDEGRAVKVAITPVVPHDDVRLHAVWLWVSRGDLERTGVAIAPSIILTASPDLLHMGWALEGPVDEDAYRVIARDLGSQLGEGWAVVASDAWLAVPGTPMRCTPGRMVEVVPTGARYDASDLSSQLAAIASVHARTHAAQSDGPGGTRDAVNNAVTEGNFELTDTEEELGSASDGGADPDRAPSSDVVAAAARIRHAPDILALVRDQLQRSGFAGSPSVPLLVFLVVVSRLLPKPASLAVKGQSSAGKNAAVDAALQFFPEEAWIGRTNLSTQALYYSGESFVHRTLVLFEGQMLKEGELAATVRSLLSEGQLVREVTNYDQRDTFVLRTDGPTGLITTTTLLSLDPELETRILSAQISDGPELTRAILLAQARREQGHVQNSDLKGWKRFHTEMAELDTRPLVPFAEQLAELVDVTAVRMRRDFPTILTLINAHALLHEASRDRDDQGRILATISDYAAVHAAVAGVVAETTALSVSPKSRSTIEAVRQVLADGRRAYVTIPQLADALRVDPSNARRRVYEGFAAGHLVNLSARGRPIHITLGETLPEDRQAMPTPEQLADACGRACTQR